ncbi:hypothetical protein [Streptomyces bambusae]|uniref:Uncharacterized protein n=1 Tax=Streptomyces bambusae TaxID=1550616 RepID=A0ABS6Z781_9ACTN|nr:hypothetical protein [Streptomyces bambusae]MBW5483625.1 hypothetical protein [Streptomyces bambusae]
MLARPVKAALTCVVATVSLTLAATAPPAGAVDGPAPDHRDRKAMQDMATAIRVTAKYVDEATAVKDGFVRRDDCLNDPRGTGAMGYHYVKWSNWGSTDPSRPTALIYGPEKGPRGGRKLYAVEWMVSDSDQDLTTKNDRPTMFGLPFDGPMPGHWKGMPKHYDIHMWTYKDNPAGPFHNWNPAVTCPTSSHTHP